MIFDILAAVIGVVIGIIIVAILIIYFMLLLIDANIRNALGIDEEGDKQ